MRTSALSLSSRVSLLCAAAASLVTAGGCLSWFTPNAPPPVAGVPPGTTIGPPVVGRNNPMLVPVLDRDLLWDQLVDVVDDYFKVLREERVRLEGDMLTEGIIDTYPRSGSTILEPWNRDSATPYERLESTLQSIRRRAIVHVIPAEGGYLVDVQVYKELEDVVRPDMPSAGAADLSNDNSLRRNATPVGGQQPTLGWIPLGRDVALEQEMLGQIQARFMAGPAPPPY